MLENSLNAEPKMLFAYYYVENITKNEIIFMIFSSLCFCLMRNASRFCVVKKIEEKEARTHTVCSQTWGLSAFLRPVYPRTECSVAVKNAFGKKRIL